MSWHITILYFSDISNYRTVIGDPMLEGDATTQCKWQKQVEDISFRRYRGDTLLLSRRCAIAVY